MRCPNCGTEIPAGFKFCGQCGARLSSGTSAQTEADPTAGERREVAVLFADVSGFTAMSEKLDPEDIRDVMNQCFAGIGAAIQDEGGYIDKYIGDNVMALFGAPTAHEDDPARACRAALAVHAFLGGISEKLHAKTEVRLRMRIGIHCGLVLAGGVGSEVKMDYSVMGDTVNLASRLESAAPPGGVLVSNEVRRRVRDGFTFGPVQHLRVKGKEAAVAAYELLGETTARALNAEPATALLVGRADELESLCQRLKSQAGSDLWMEIRGEIGTGKSRLVQKALAKTAAIIPIEVAGTTTTARRPFQLVRRLLAKALGHAAKTDFETRASFESALVSLNENLTPFGGALWFLIAPPRSLASAPEEDPQAFRGIIERGVFVLLESLARRFPSLLLVLDSYERADHASATLLESFYKTAGNLLPRVLTIARDDGPPPLFPASVLRVEPLGEQASSKLLHHLAHGAVLPESLRQSILRRAAGVPLFIEEIVRALIDSGEVAPADDGTSWRYTASTGAVDLPPSLRAAMVSRLDRLPRAAREFLGRSAVQGVEFDLHISARLGGEAALPQHAATDLLPELEKRGFVRVEGRRGTFVQPLVQEACYEMLLKRERKNLHASTARSLAESAGGAENVAPETLVLHYERSEQWSHAAHANLRAGDRAAGLFLNENALESYRRVVETGRKASDEAEPMRRAAILAHFGAARVNLRTGQYDAAREEAEHLCALAAGDGECAEGWRLLAQAHARVGEATEALALLDKVTALPAVSDFPNKETTALSWYALAELHHRANRLEAAIEALQRCREAAPEKRSRTAVRADLLEGSIAHTRGDFKCAAALYETAYEMAGQIGSLSERARAMNNLGNAARDVGDYPVARSHYEKALELWSRIGETECIAGAHNNLGNLAMSTGDYVVAREHYGQSLAAALKIGNVHGAALANANLAILALEENDGREAVSSARAALELLEESANDLLRGLVEVVLGDGLVLCNETDDAAEHYQRVFTGFTEANHPLAIFSAKRGMARAAAARGDLENAEKLLSYAASGFQKLKRSQEEARTILEHARLKLRSGNTGEARRLAANALERFQEIRAGRDADRARQFLEELSR